MGSKLTLGEKLGFGFGGRAEGKLCLRIKQPCPAFWGVAPRNMKTGREDSGAYFRTKAFYRTR